jgi:hypothetical protein
MQRTRRSIMVFAGVVLMVATTATPSAAATQAYTATFPKEQTVQRTCPQGLPATAFCFTGSDRSGLGTSTLPPFPGMRATESFAGFVDFSSPIASACVPILSTLPRTPGFPDHNVVSISISAGDLFVTTNGVDCTNTGTDKGTWRVVGGTGRFRDASGGGTVSTQATGGSGTAADPIRSASTYAGKVTFER